MPRCQFVSRHTQSQGSATRVTGHSQVLQTGPNSSSSGSLTTGYTYPPDVFESVFLPYPTAETSGSSTYSTDNVSTFTYDGALMGVVIEPPYNQTVSGSSGSHGVPGFNIGFGSTDPFSVRHIYCHHHESRALYTSGTNHDRLLFINGAQINMPTQPGVMADFLPASDVPPFLRSTLDTSS